MLSNDEAKGLLGEMEVLDYNINRGRQALIAFVEGRFGKRGEPNVGDVLAFNNAVTDAGSIVQRMSDESRDPDGVFG